MRSVCFVPTALQPFAYFEKCTPIRPILLNCLWRVNTTSQIPTCFKRLFETRGLFSALQARLSVKRPRRIVLTRSNKAHCRNLELRLGQYYYSRMKHCGGEHPHVEQIDGGELDLSHQLDEHLNRQRRFGGSFPELPPVTSR